uniref:JmjC domain-containing protein n=1 Tax=Ciona savignyi TaxID=51511 RepID=H2Z9X2_CIOSA
NNMACLWICALLLHFCNGLSEVPVGHLKPLGFQRPPSVIIDEFTVDNAPSPVDFYRNYVSQGKAAIFRGAILQSKAFKTWSDEYIRETFGELEARIEGKKEKGGGIPAGETYMGRDTFRHFVDTYHNSSSYMVSELPEQMYKDVGVIPSVGACGLMAKRFVEIDIWWNGGGGKSIIHKDAFNQINCLYRGTKQWKIFEYKYEKWIYQQKEREEGVGGFSKVNVDSVDLIRYKDFAKIPWSNITIFEGDCLYLPKSDYHQVFSEGTNNLAVSILFSRLDDLAEFDASDCTDDTDYKALKPLSEFDVMWKWSGKGYMSMGRGDVENYREELIEVVEQMEHFTASDLEQMHGLDMTDQRSKEKFPDIERRNMTKVFTVFDKNSDGILTSDEVRAATWEDFRLYGLHSEEYEPSNSYIFEYSLIPYEMVHGLLKRALKIGPILTRKHWVKIYVKYTQGTPYYANNVFNGLVGDGDQVVVKDIT